MPLTCHEACIFIARFLTCQGARELSFLFDVDHKSCVLVMIFRSPAPRLRQHRDCCTGPYCWRDAGVKEASVVDLSCRGDRLCTTCYLHFITIRLLTFVLSGVKMQVLIGRAAVSYISDWLVEKSGEFSARLQQETRFMLRYFLLCPFYEYQKVAFLSGVCVTQSCGLRRG
jgi:hypothetical protein